MTGFLSTKAAALRQIRRMAGPRRRPSHGSTVGFSNTRARPRLCRRVAAASRLSARLSRAALSRTARPTARTSPVALWADARRGLTLPRTLAATIVLGAFLMLTRLVLGTSGEMANSDHVVGALVITVSIITTAEVARALRFINAAFGGWLIAAPFLLEGADAPATIASVVIGLLLIALSLPRGERSREHYAGWDKYVL